MFNSEIFLISYIENKNCYEAHAHKIIHKDLLIVAERLNIKSVLLYPEQLNINLAKDYIIPLEEALKHVVIHHELHNFIKDLIILCKLYPNSLLRISL